MRFDYRREFKEVLKCLCTCHRLPRGGGPWAVGGGIGDFVGTNCSYICAPVEGEKKGLCFIMPQIMEKYGDFASAKAYR